MQSEFEVPRGLKLKVHSLQKYCRPGELIVCSRLFWHLIAEIANFSFNLRCMSFVLQFFFFICTFFPSFRITSPIKFSWGCSLAILLTFLRFATNKTNEIKLLESCGVLVLTFSEIDSLFSYDYLSPRHLFSLITKNALLEPPNATGDFRTENRLKKAELTLSILLRFLFFTGCDHNLIQLRWISIVLLHDKIPDIYLNTKQTNQIKTGACVICHTTSVSLELTLFPLFN